jgi:hypothetical protein
MKKSIVALLLAMVLTTSVVADDHWAQFRRPGSLGVAGEPRAARQME